MFFRVEKHVGNARKFDDALGGHTGFPSAEKAAQETADKFPELSLTMFRVDDQGTAPLIIGRRRVGHTEWTWTKPSGLEDTPRQGDAGPFDTTGDHGSAQDVRSQRGPKLRPRAEAAALGRHRAPGHASIAVRPKTDWCHAIIVLADRRRVAPSR